MKDGKGGLPFGAKPFIMIDNYPHCQRGWVNIYKTVLFDLDGTLLDTLQDLANAGERVCAANGWPAHPVQAYRQFVGNGIPKLVERIAPPAARGAATLAGALAQFQAEYAAHMFDCTAPYPGIAALLQALRGAGVQLGVFSNKDDGLARRVVARYFAPETFAGVRGAVAGVPPKPHPQGVHDLLAALHADPAATLFVGDSDVDVFTAHNAGLACCGVLWGFRSREELQGAGAEFLAADPAQLQRVILQQGAL